jgi:hypothetical protein
MALDVLKDENGKHSIGRYLTVLAALVLSYGFVEESIARNLDWKDFVAYALAMVMTYSTAKAVELIRALKGTDRNGKDDIPLEKALEDKQEDKQ